MAATTTGTKRSRRTLERWLEHEIAGYNRHAPRSWVRTQARRQAVRARSAGAR